jgi:hypothetical protein
MEGRIRSRTVVERSRRGFDQRRLWSQVADRLEGSGVVSGTSDYHSFLASNASTLGDRARNLQSEPGQIGLLILRGNRLVALELVATPELWKRVAARTLPALLLADETIHANGPAADPERWLAEVAKHCVTKSTEVGLGTDVTVASDGFTGCGHWLGNSIAHLAVFGRNW